MAAAMLTVVVVFPTPPFWLATVSTRVVTGRGQASVLPPRILAAAAAATAMGVSS
jgi:hypothetical protein